MMGSQLVKCFFMASITCPQSRILHGIYFTKILIPLWNMVATALDADTFPLSDARPPGLRWVRTDETGSATSIFDLLEAPRISIAAWARR